MKLYGTLIADKIVPTDSQDTFPTHDEEYGFGGFRTVLNIPQRDLISMDRRKEGMLVFCLSDRSLYQLIGGIQNTHWIKFNNGYAEIKRVPFFSKSEVTIENIANHPIVAIYIEQPAFKPILFGEYHFREPIFRQEFEMNESRMIEDYDIIYTPASQSLRAVFKKNLTGVIVISE